MIAPKRGVVFTHRSFLDKDRQPALMRIICVRQGRVYYTYADEPNNRGAFYMDRDTWTERYGQAPTDEFANSERDIRLVAIAAHARGDFEAERLALDRLALMERGADGVSS